MFSSSLEDFNKKPFNNKDKADLATGIVVNFVSNKYPKKDKEIIYSELAKINSSIRFDDSYKLDTYQQLQDLLSTLNENDVDRKKNGVYYTPFDLVKYIVINSIKLRCDKLTPTNLHVENLNGIPYFKTCYNFSTFDPTCGAGEFLLGMLNTKFDLLEMHIKNITKKQVNDIVSTIYGNDLNSESVRISQIRILLAVLERYGIDKIKGISEILRKNFTCYDFITEFEGERNEYDIIIGNPPYVEDSVSGLSHSIRYGNIYANVLDNASTILKQSGVMSFIVPLSYVSTPRMRFIREILNKRLGRHYILSFSDRPDCLFAGVHQKLCIAFFKDSDDDILYTSAYNYWYKDERKQLFENLEIVKNEHEEDKFIPKFGNNCDIRIYKKLLMHKETLFQKLDREEGLNLYLNMRATFWIKLFDNSQKSAEYKEYICKKDELPYIYCLLNSSLFWWYWICVSDCWHITQKELKILTVPPMKSMNKFDKLYTKLKYELEQTKVYVGTKQIDYEYKHKECLKTIHEIDDLINESYGLTEKESLYIKNFSLRYRIGGGADT